MNNQFPITKIIDDDGTLLDTSYEEQLTEALSYHLYHHMYRIRTFDRKAISLQRQGRIGTYPPFEGQEAAQVGSAYALGEDDWVFPTYRDHGATLTFGADMTRMFMYWNGRVEGCVPPEGKRIFPAAVPIATQIPHAVGAAWAEKKKGTDNIALVYFGDGATSEGDFHEGLNFAGVFQTPTVFFNQNNGYAISVPFEKQTNSATIAQKAIAYDIPSVRIDGNDCFAVYFTTKEAIDAARKGKGPTLIEAVTWRTGAHTTADDPSKYRPEHLGTDTVDPLERLERFMKTYGHWNDEKIAEIEQTCQAEVETAVEQMENASQPNVDDMFNHVFAELPDHLANQKLAYEAFLKEES
ncbi:pyruvate dehydrogenase (acetyl-transferring) E1 component subunit alpha [Lentibacillus saliphilus]|uniref:pyruvate dehydrogenase (acetyl-transferring) E1 component subunit alpha n=1 Tax=Lentibacillus saliphilus TaxID=2737028 RepID=UPI001C2FD207|nr:pyruvate dehydrogenase (acetyl-transferring) E1 component subunit alpha [Lentibacillus saliphilus]